MPFCASPPSPLALAAFPTCPPTPECHGCCYLLLLPPQFSVLRRRPFTWEYMAEMFPPSAWGHPLLRRAGYTAAFAWMASLATMLGAAVVSGWMGG